MIDLTCERCGGQMIDASPVEIFCDNPECEKEDMAIAIKWMKEIRLNRERKEYERLKKKFEPDEVPKGQLNG